MFRGSHHHRNDGYNYRSVAKINLNIFKLSIIKKNILMLIIIPPLTIDLNLGR
jgi:hypothetical protein